MVHHMTLEAQQFIHNVSLASRNSIRLSMPGSQCAIRTNPKLHSPTVVFRPRPNSVPSRSPRFLNSPLERGEWGMGNVIPPSASQLIPSRPAHIKSMLSQEPLSSGSFSGAAKKGRGGGGAGQSTVTGPVGPPIDYSLCKGELAPSWRCISL